MSRWNQDEYIKALIFAGNAHGSQRVPGTQLPYLVHLALVSMEVMAAVSAEDGMDGTLAVQCASLHDVIEDAGIAWEQVAELFGRAVADGVNALSKDSTLPKAEQMEDSLERIRRQPREIWMVKLADRITNLQPPPAHWLPEKIAGYREEAVQIHAALQDASPFLAARLKDKIDHY
jgi:(p)ppGpp synthase/HD superfamily hydrolase